MVKHTEQEFDRRYNNPNNDGTSELPDNETKLIQPVNHRAGTKAAADASVPLVEGSENDIIVRGSDANDKYNTVYKSLQDLASDVGFVSNPNADNAATWAEEGNQDPIPAEKLTNSPRTSVKDYAVSGGRQIQAGDIEDGVIPTGLAHSSWRGHFTTNTSYSRNDVVHWGTILFLARRDFTSSLFPENDPDNWEVLGHWKGSYHAQYQYAPGDLVTNNSIVYLLVANSATTGVTPFCKQSFSMEKNFYIY